MYVSNEASFNDPRLHVMMQWQVWAKYILLRMQPYSWIYKQFALLDVLLANDTGWSTNVINSLRRSGA